MSLLDDARRLDQLRVRQSRMICAICKRPFADAEAGHAADCPLLSMLRIVAALEVGALMASRMSQAMYCNGCGAESDHVGGLDDASRHGLTCERWAFISALRGDPKDLQRLEVALRGEKVSA